MTALTEHAVVHAPIPDSHADLLDRPLPAVLTTHLADGRLQSSVAWFWRHDGEVRISAMLESETAASMLTRPRATLLVMDPADGRWLELRADVAPVPGSGLADLDDAAERYRGVRPYFGGVVAAELAELETPVTFRLAPRAVVAGPTSSRPPVGPAPGGRPPRWVPSGQDVPIPPSHRDLLDRPIAAALATHMPGGRAQVQPVRCTRDGDLVLVTTTLERRKGRNLVTDPRATVLVIDPADPDRWLEVRCDVEVRTEGAARLLDRLTRAYTGQPPYYGHVPPAVLAVRATTETRAVARLHPRRVTCDATRR